MHVYHGENFRKQYFDAHEPFFSSEISSCYDDGYEFKDIFEDTYHVTFWFYGDWSLEFHKYDKIGETSGYKGKRYEGLSMFKNSDISDFFTSSFKSPTFKEFCINDYLYPAIYDTSNNDCFNDHKWIKEVKDEYYQNINPYKLSLNLIIGRQWNEVIRHECIYNDGNFKYTLIEFDDCYIGIYKDTT